MKKLRDVWSEKVINGSFKGSARDFALQAFRASSPLIYRGKQVQSMLELMAIPDDMLFLSEDTSDSKASIHNVLKTFEGKEVDAKVLLDRLRPFMNGNEDILAKLYNEGLLEYRMDKTYIKPKLAKVGSFKKTAKVEMKADVLFSQNALNCPNCGMKMKSVKLVGEVGAYFCSNCRHADFDEKTKATSHAGIQTLDKVLQFKHVDNGNCEILN